MRKIILYIAASLDGKIARLNGDVNWLNQFPNPENTDHGYADFLSGIDITLMGNTTYKEILGFGIDFPYSDKENYVFTRNTELEKDENVSFISGNIVAFVKALKMKDGNDIWLVGGSQLNTLFFNYQLVDELILFIMPIILGEGIPLFNQIPHETMLKLIKTETFCTGAVGLFYKII